MNTSFYQGLNQNGDDVFVDLVSLQHYFDTEEEDLEKIVTEHANGIETLKNDPWRLLILEDEILGKCGAGVFECSDTTTNGKRRKRSPQMWDFLDYIPVRTTESDLDSRNTDKMTILIIRLIYRC